MRINVLVLTIMAGLLVYTGNALACDTCGCQDKPAGATCACGMAAGECTMCNTNAEMGSAAAMGADPSYTCACGMSIYDCASCLKSEGDKLAAHLGSVQPLPAGMTVLSRTIAPFAVSYLESQGMAQIEATFNDLMSLAGQQNLIGATSRVYGVYRGDLYGEFDDNTVYQAAVSIPADANPSAPLKSETIPGGEYLVVVHHGDYANLGDTYKSFLTWAAAAGVTFDDRPSFEHYFSDPATTPVADLLTEIYLPVANPHATSADAGTHGHEGAVDGHDHA